MFQVTTLEEANFGGLYFISEILFLNDKVYYLVKIGQSINIVDRLNKYNVHNTAYHYFPSSAIKIENQEERNNYEKFAHTILRMLKVYDSKKCKEWFFVSEYVYNALKDNPWKIFEPTFSKKLIDAPESKIKYKQIEKEKEEIIKTEYIPKIEYITKTEYIIKEIPTYKPWMEENKKRLEELIKQDKDFYSKLNKIEKKYFELGKDLNNRNFFGRLLYAILKI